jgi:hypothetical protein
MSNDIALNILKDLMTKLIDKFDEMPRRQEVADDLTTLANGVTQIATKLNTPPRHEELKGCVDEVSKEVGELKTGIAAVVKGVGDLGSKINRFLLVAGIVVALFFLVAIFTEVYTTIRTPAQTTDVHSYKDILDKLDDVQKRMDELHPEKK